MQKQDFSRLESRRCWRVSREPDLQDLMRDPLTLAVMAADRVERHDLENLLAGARKNLLCCV
jgi:hypothetical protein